MIMKKVDVEEQINGLLAIYSEKVEETTIRYDDGKEWMEYDFVKWLVCLMNESNRPSLEWLVYWSLSQEHPIISISRGRELLNFDTMNEMREWMNQYKAKRESDKAVKEGRDDA